MEKNSVKLRLKQLPVAKYLSDWEREWFDQMATTVNFKNGQRKLLSRFLCGKHEKPRVDENSWRGQREALDRIIYHWASNEWHIYFREPWRDGKWIARIVEPRPELKIRVRPRTAILWFVFASVSAAASPSKQMKFYPSPKSKYLGYKPQLYSNH